MSGWIIKTGDACEWLAKLAPSSADALVCDPPAGIGFMGKEWDHDHGHRDEWIKAFAAILALALRAMKPGAHGLVWALPRTSHWTATALEDAGFEIRDIVMHLFGSGFPKSLNVSKAIDERLGAIRGPTGEVTTRHGGGVRSGKIRQLDPDAKETPITAPGSPEATRFEGWGTALKPAAEHWILVRKPLDGTVAANVLKYGTGGLNINAARIGSEARFNPPAGYQPGDNVYMMGVHGMPQDAGGRTATGRWPANVTLDEEAAAALDEQSGRGRGSAASAPGTVWAPGVRTSGYTDVGGASRFFYVAKPSRKERDAGCDDLLPKSGGLATDREDGSAGLESPRAGAGRGGGARNHHPTVKSIVLMEYLIKLITPQGGIVLDPFMGSGSTGVAAVRAGFNFVGIEREAEYVEIATRRIAHAARGEPA